MSLELLSRVEERAGKYWPWSKKKVQWILSISGVPCVVEITHSWNSGISRLFVNRQFMTSDATPEFRFTFSPAPDVTAVALVSNSKPALEVDGWPVEWLSARVRREQAAELSVFNPPGGYTPMRDRFQDSSTASSVRQPLMY